ncbi:tRNA lysidine(34) synthetase TilS [Cohnella caldifontis]|uniref:tRNA lysidine(34) synthetase TilS n=1 Tax=Cohnella caldifontis TaxID=3027471 RepID=UPI0023EDCAC0|nr:tRNA lysidine(34) synthetase TilS [Cohnella sp. YIM B05605]
MESRDDLLDRMLEVAEAEGWQPDQTVIAAVSGGPDSMALLHLLMRMAERQPMRVVAAHVNHRFRGAESEAEAELVRQAASDWGAGFETASIDVPSYIEETGLNAQSAAREKRYDFLKRTAEAYGAGQILLGHHADDQAETVLMRVLRGTGVGGLAGIPYRRKEENVELIRPLLRITKRELLSYCERNGVPFAVDSSNLKRDYFRNAVRLDAIPWLERYNPRLKESLIRLADMAAADDDYLEREASARLGSVATRDGYGFRLKRRRFRGLHVALQRRLIKLILRYSSDPWHPAQYRQIEEVLEAAADESHTVGRMDLGGGWVLVREYDEVYIGPPYPSEAAYRYEVGGFPRTLALGEGRSIRFERMDGALTSLPTDRREAFFDEAALELPLAVRTRQPGDRMEPAGLNGSKKVQDMFVDAKIPRSKRDGWPLLADASGRILWIPGLRRSVIAQVGPDTRSTIRVSFLSDGSDP